MNNKSKRGSIFLLVLLVGLISVLSVNALVVTNFADQIVIGIYNVSDVGSRSYGYGPALFNLSNISNTRPFINFNVSMFNGSTANISLFVVGAGDTLGVAVFPNVNNETVAGNDTLTTIYFNNSLIDGYYTWWINASNFSLDIATTEAYNKTNRTDYYAIIIDTQAPNLTYLATSADNGRAVTTNITTPRSIFINVSTNDTLDGTIRTVGGGFVTFELHNRTTGLLNRTTFARNAFNTIVAFAFRNFSYVQNNDLDDD